jgi:hypothetical protein
MDKKRSMTIIILVAAVSCAVGLLLANQITPSAIAQTGTFSAPTFSEPQYSECFAVTLWLHTGRALNKGALPKKMVRIPVGWTPVGGGARGQANEGVLILCR